METVGCGDCVCVVCRLLMRRLVLEIVLVVKTVVDSIGCGDCWLWILLWRLLVVDTIVEAVGCGEC